MRLADDDKLKAPSKKCNFDLIKLIRSVDFEHLLRDARHYQPALAAGRKVDQDPSDEEVAPRDTSNDPSRSTRVRARHRFDIVVLLLQRMEFEEWVTAGVLQSLRTRL